MPGKTICPSARKAVGIKMSKVCLYLSIIFFKVNIWKVVISQSITIFSKDNMFQVKLIKLVDLNELKDSYFYYLFFHQYFFSYYYFLLFPFILSLSLSLFYLFQRF